ncbi:DNA-binding transcriptional regulator, AcrR family [Cyclobacterium xiamenense]|jgi:AcrR family transcriptional regulator|uniref:Biofilm operon icaADBC HTH-type negative transcriptional regulator IcaR n=1 Tax=Cyclobacterium xiamenense TaxID=1297121 RepID=A0A1H7ASH4_9BACT|nr:TetR family transcriptional regulator [Cyclobacterium xiamenense]SEJ65042.1 DNA-binding transcriptional regulator, AcrR family [Cyclobacterium xiamenense]
MKNSIRKERKKEIISGLYELSQSEGLENVSIAKIGKHLGMPPSLVMHYFPNKRLLILGLIDHILHQYQLIYKPIISKMENQPRINPELLVDRLFSRDWNLLFDDGVFFSCYAFIFRDASIKREYKNLHVKLRMTLKTLLDKDEVLMNGDTGLLAERIFVVIEGAYYYLSMMDDPKTYDEKLKIFKDQVYELIYSEINRLEQPARSG